MIAVILLVLLAAAAWMWRIIKSSGGVGPAATAGLPSNSYHRVAQ